MCAFSTLVDFRLVCQKAHNAKPANQAKEAAQRYLLACTLREEETQHHMQLDVHPFWRSGFPSKSSQKVSGDVTQVRPGLDSSKITSMQRETRGMLAQARKRNLELLKLEAISC